MRFKSEFGILLVLLLGFLCVSPIYSYYEERVQTSDNVTLVSDVSSSLSNEQQSFQQSLFNEPNDPNQTATSAVEDDLTHSQEKRSGNIFGIPSSRGNNENSHPPSDTGSSEQNANDQDLTSQQEQQQKVEAAQPKQADTISPPVNPPLSNEPQFRTSKDQAEQEGSIPASTARGFGSMVNGLSNNLNIQPPPSLQVGTNQQKIPSAPHTSVNQPSPGSNVSKDNLPTIIENDKPVNIEQQYQQNNQQTSPPQVTSLVSQNPANVSTARTFGEGWTNCVGSTTGKYGTCKNDVECNKSKGVSDGSCMGGLGMCCVMALTCGDKSFENNTFFANPDFPEPSWEARLCEVEIKKKHSKILQVMIEFEEFELAPPNHDGECITDVFQVKLSSSRPSPYSLLRICGQNTGQHMYLDVSQLDEPLVLSVATSGGGFPRRWSIRIVQMDEKNHLLAPPGCLQFYTDTVGHFRSFNLGRNLRNLYYAICFRIDNGYSGIRFTSNFFGMNGSGCRRIGKHHSTTGLLLGRFNGTYPEAHHPNHLVIPPPGYAPPPPRPKFIAGSPHHGHPTQPTSVYHPTQHPHQPPNYFHTSPTPMANYEQYQAPPGNQPLRYKRFAYSESSERIPRTFGSEHHDHHKFESEHNDHHKESKFEDKRIKHEENHHSHPPPPLPPPPPPPPSYGYGPSYQPTYSPQQAYPVSPQYPTYGPTHPIYGQHEYPPHHDSYRKDEFKGKWATRWDDKDIAKAEKWEDLDNKKSWWDATKFGWKADKKDDKFGWKSDKDESGYGGYGPPAHGYGPGYKQHPHGYGQGAYATPGYGYKHEGYGEYHHKEIDKFGKKYEHLELKHEKNHLDKEDKKDDKSWWFWGKKEDKKDKEKFFTHHEALFPIMHLPEMPHCEPRFCGQNDVITFPPSGDSISEMCGNRFNRGRGPKIISGSPLVVYVSNRGHSRGAGFDMNYEQVFYIPRPY